MLNISLLGWPQFTHNGQKITGFVSDKALATLAYLILTSETHSRDKLATLLWGDLPDKRAKANLRNVIYNLQQLLGDYLEVTRRTIAFRPQPDTTIDIELLRSAETIADQRTALASVRGDLLDGFHLTHSDEAFEHWLLREREALRLLAIAALESVAAEMQLQGKLADAIDYLTKLAQLEPYRESVQRDLLLLQARSGKHATALVAFQQFQQQLMTEIGVEPLPESLALVERVKQAAQGQRDNLPLQRSPFIGRADLLQQLHQHILHPHKRLITLIGPGGIGKTRLALHAAQQARHTHLNGVAFVELATLAATDSENMAEIVALAIIQTLANAQFIAPRVRGSAQQHLQTQLANLELLLVLDNFEHVIDAAGAIDQLLATAPHLSILVTSRERLMLDWEHVIDVTGLHYPRSAEAMNWEHFPAIQLFLQQVKRIKSDYQPSSAERSALTQLCMLTEGMPLALELAGSQMRATSCQVIVNALQQGLDVLSTRQRLRPKRHRSIRALFEQSWGVLGTLERQILLHLSVFRGSFSAEAADVVANASIFSLLELIDRSLLTQQTAEDGSVRYRLHPLLQQFAAEKLDTTETSSQAVVKHTHYYTGWLVEQQHIVYTFDSLDMLKVMRPDIANIEAAWDDAIKRQRWDTLFAGYHTMIRYYRNENQYRRIIQLAAQILAALPNKSNKPFVGLLLATKSFGHMMQSEYAEAITAARLAAQTAEAEQSANAAFVLAHSAQTLVFSKEIVEGLELAHQASVWANLYGTAFERALAYNSLGVGYLVRREYKQSLDNYHRANEQFEQMNGYMQARTLVNIGNLYHSHGDVPTAIAFAQRALPLLRREANTYIISNALHNLGIWSGINGFYQQACHTLIEAIQMRRPLQLNRELANSLRELARQYLYQEQPDKARPLLNEALLAARTVNEQHHLFETYATLLWAACQANDFETMQTAIYELNIARQHAKPNPAFIALSHIYLGLAAQRWGTSAEATNHWQCSLAEAEKVPDHEPSQPWAHALLGMLAIERQAMTEIKSHLDQIDAYFAQPSTITSGLPAVVARFCYDAARMLNHSDANQRLANALRYVYKVAEQFEDSAERAHWLNLPDHQYLRQQAEIYDWFKALTISFPLV